MLCIISTLMVLSFFFSSRILQTGLNQVVENQKQNQDNTGRFGMKNLPKRLVLFLPKRPVPLFSALIFFQFMPKLHFITRFSKLVTMAQLVVRLYLADTRSWVRTRDDALLFLAESIPVLSGRLVNYHRM